MRLRALPAVVLGFAAISSLILSRSFAVAQKICARPAAGSIAAEPEDLRSQNGELRLSLTYRNFKADNGQEEYCYQYKDGAQAPTLRLHPGDLLVLQLKNSLSSLTGFALAQPAAHHALISAAHAEKQVSAASAFCAGTQMQMSALSTNLHFHGTSLPPVCHQDDVLHTLIQPGDPPFEYRFRIPSDEPPGLYWYHPHVHGFTNPQVLGGASGALIVEGIERANRRLGGLPERVFVIRDQELLYPDAPSAEAALTPPPPVLRDPEGDVLNSGTGGGKPAKDLSINFVPVPYPKYPPAVVQVKPGERQLWRVLNASAITYLDLQLVVNEATQSLGVVSLDGVPINENGLAQDRVLWVDHVSLPPAGRVEFIVKGIAAGTNARLLTRSVDTGPAGENDPARPLATVVATDRAFEPSRLGAASTPLPRSDLAWLGNVKPVRTRKLYFSERPQDPGRPASPTVFMITLDGQTPAPFDPHAAQPNITARQGDVEDWIIENRSTEAHAFHIHQTHFLLMQWDGVPVDEPFLRDTINVPYWDGKSKRYPSVTLRMDFRNPDAVGTFVYHCHLLEHEDAGMMGTIQILPRAEATPAERP